MRKLQLLLNFFPVGYHNIILIIETNKVLKYLLDPCEFRGWVGCLLYMSCWIDIAERRDWWSVTPPVIHRGPPFSLNECMPCHQFYEILAYFRYTNR